MLSLERPFTQESAWVFCQAGLMGVTACLTTKRYTNRKGGRHVKLGAYQCSSRITEWRYKTHKNNIECGQYVRSLWNGGNPG